MKPSIFRRLVAAAVLSCVGAAQAVTWPNLSGVGICRTTLQNCIDTVAAGDVVVIGVDDLFIPDGYTAVDEDIAIGKSLTLAAADGIDAVFAPGRSIVVTSPLTGATSVTLRRLVLRRGHVTLTHFSDGTSSFLVDALRIAETDAAMNCAIQFFDYGSGRAEFTAGNTTIELSRPVSGACGLFAQGNGGAWQGGFSGNRIRATNGAGSAANLIRVLGTSAGTFRIGGNQLSGSGYAGGIGIEQQAASAANTWYVDNNVVTGQRTTPLSGFAGILVQPRNTDLRIVNNTVRDGTQGLWVFSPPATPDTSAVAVANNIVAFHGGIGVLVSGSLIPVTQFRSNLVFANAAGDTTAPGIATADPRFVGPRNARLVATSPARNAGSNGDVPSLSLDADGERRINLDGPVDIGAFEFSLDRSLIHTSTTEDACCNDTPIRETFADGIGANETLLATPHGVGATPAQLAQNIGVYLFTASPVVWSLFHENTDVPMQAGRRFGVFAPGYGYDGFVHTTAAANVVGRYTRLPALSGGVNAIAFVTHNWNPGGVGGTYHDRRVGLERFGGEWYVRNEDPAIDMPVGVSFNVIVAPFFNTVNAWRQAAAFATARVTLAHPALDDNPCAAPQVTRLDDPATPAIVNDDVPFAVRYVAGYGGAPGHWAVTAEGPGSPTFPAGAAFNVMVPGAQAGACRDDDRIFADPFEL